jgi:hypothetical protein
MLIDVVRVAPRHDFTLELEYANGELRLFDMAPWLSVRPWLPLRAWSLFRQARVHYGTVTWPGDLDMAPETLYDASTPLEPRPGAAPPARPSHQRVRRKRTQSVKP